MNLFLLSYNVEENAQFHCDKHVVKMVLEAAQLLSTAYTVSIHLGYSPRALRKDELLSLKGISKGPAYKCTHVNHPLAIFTRTSEENFEFVRQYGLSLGKEYTHRYSKVHKSEDVLRSLVAPKSLPKLGLSPFEICTKDKPSKDPVECYRHYYIQEKARFATWKKRETPTWFLCENEPLKPGREKEDEARPDQRPLLASNNSQQIQ